MTLLAYLIAMGSFKGRTAFNCPTALNQVQESERSTPADIYLIWKSGMAAILDIQISPGNVLAHFDKRNVKRRGRG